MGKIKGYRVLATPHDVAQFLFFLVFECKVDVNPDEKFIDYVDKDGNQTFTDEEAECYDKMLETSFDICESYHIDIFEINMRVLALYHFCDDNKTMCKFYDSWFLEEDK